MKQYIHKYFIGFFIFSFFLTIQGFAQESYLLKELRIPQAAQENPGAVIPYDAHVCFPLLGKTHVGINLPLNYGDIYSLSEDMLKKVKKNNDIRAWVQNDPIHFGFRVNKKNYFSITTAVKADVNITFREDLATFLVKGNALSENEKLSFVGNDLGSINSYIEFGVGYNREVNDNISFGVNAKYLLGLVNAYTEKAELSLYTGDKYNELILNHTLQGKMASIHDIESDDFDINDMLQNLKNHGFAIDLGARYRINKLFEVNAAVLDIGFINWKSYPKQYNVIDETFSVVGYQYDDIFGDSDEGIGNFDPKRYLESIVDSITEIFISEIEPSASYTKWLNTRFSIGGSIYASRNDRFNFTFNGKFINGAFVPSGSISYHRTCGKWFDFVIGNTFKRNAIFNPGIGMNLTLGVFQLYCAVDYTNTFVYIDKVKNLNVAFGINFVAPMRGIKNFKASYPY